MRIQSAVRARLAREELNAMRAPQNGTSILTSIKLSIGANLSALGLLPSSEPELPVTAGQSTAARATSHSERRPSGPPQASRALGSGLSRGLSSSSRSQSVSNFLAAAAAPRPRTARRSSSAPRLVREGTTTNSSDHGRSLPTRAMPASGPTTAGASGSVTAMSPSTLPV